MRVPVRRSRSRTSIGFHALSTLFLLLGVLSPVLPAATVAAQQGGNPPPLPAPNRVALAGSFQTTLGCPQDNDASCQTTQLTNGGDGIWTGVFAIPAGAYSFRVVASSDVDRSLGEGGDPNGADIGLRVPDGTVAVYFAYDTLTGEITAEPVTHRATLVTDQGDRHDMAPARRGGYETSFDAQPGNYGFQILFDDQPVAQDTISLDAPSRVIVTVDDQGAVTGKDTVQDTVLTVTKSDASGAPLAGACFAVLTRDDQLAGQGCDGDDGAADGQTRLRFPSGLATDSYGLQEVATPDGQDASERQRIDLGPGAFTAEATTGGGAEPTTEPATETATTEPGIETPEAETPATGQQAGRVLLRSTDDAGESLAGSCFQLVELGIEECDDDGDGDVVFDNVPPGTYTLTQTTAPKGYQGTADTQIDVGADGVRLRVPLQPDEAGNGGITPVTPESSSPVATEAAAQGTERGSLAVSVADANGDAVTGACFVLTSRDDAASDTLKACDKDDGNDDGQLAFDRVPAGRYRLDETRTPDGYQPADGQNVEIGSGEAATATVTYRAAEGQPGRLVILVVDDNNKPVGETCFALQSDAASFDNICDQGNDGRLNIPDLPAGDYTVHQLQTAPDHEVAEDQQVTVAAGDTKELTVTNAAAAATPTEAPTETPAETGAVAIAAEDAAGNPAAGGCYALSGGNQAPVCDNGPGDADPDSGQVRIEDVAAGDYDVTEVQPPAGAEPATEPGTITVAAGETARVRFSAAASATETATAEPTVEPAEETTPAPTEEATVEPTAETTPDQAIQAIQATDTGRLLIQIGAADGGDVGGVCVSLGGAEPVCDDKRGDENGDRDRILLADLQLGDAMLQVTAPDGYAAVPDEQVRVRAGETTRLDLTLSREATPEAAAAPGTLTILTEDSQGQPLPGACYTIANSGQTFGPFCDDNRNGDVVVTGVTPGEQTVAQTTAPEGAGPVDDGKQTATLKDGGETTLTFTHGAEEGSVLVTLEGEGRPVAGACVTLTAGSRTIGPVCDEGTALAGTAGWRLTASIQRQTDGVTDADPAAGRILIEHVPAGDYTLTVSDTPADFTAPAATKVTVKAGTRAEAEVTLPAAAAQPGRLVLLVANEDGQPVGETCFALSGPANFDNVCDQGNDGRLNIPDLPAGDYVVRQLQTAADHDLAKQQTVTVPAGDTKELEIVNRRTKAATPTEVAATVEPTASAAPTDVPAAPTETATVATGSLVVVNRGPGDEPVGGGCFTLSGPATVDVCDGGSGDAAAAPGEIGFVGLPAGTYTVTETTAPDGFSAAEPRQIEVTADNEASEVFVSQLVAAGTGSIRLEAQDADGNPVADQCFQLTGNGQDLAPICDNGDRDTDATTGVVVVDGLPEGVYEATAAPAAGAAPGTEVATAAQAVGGVERRTFTVKRNQRPIVIVLRIVKQAGTTGDLVVSKHDERNRVLAGACFALTGADGAQGTEICDDRGGDGDGTRGQIRFNAVANGAYTLTETQAPPGYDTAANQTVTIDGGRVTRVTVADAPLPATSTLTVVTADQAGNALAGACYALLKGATTIGPVCDDADGNDGRTVFADLEGGAYILRQTRAPSADYAPVADRALLIKAGQDQEIDVVDVARPGSVRILEVDEAGAALGGACFALQPAGGGDGYTLCDDDANDGVPQPGTVLLRGVAAGDYTAVETRTPPGYGSAADQAVTVTANRRSDVTFQNTALPPPPERGNLTIAKVDEGQQPLAGACFALLQGEATIAGPICDATDGANDGTIGFEGIGVGDYQLRETVRPAAGYEPIADSAVTIRLNETTQLTVTNRLRPGRVTVRKTDTGGNPLQNACFDLQKDGVGAICTDAAGLATFKGLPPATYRLTETQAPAGFLAAPPVPTIVVNPGATTTVDVVDELAPPPPDTGSIQVVKFYCPAGDGGEGTAFVDSSDPGGGRLAQTAGCTPGDAGFRLIAASGEGGPGDFATGDDGRYQTTLLAGDYTLNELTPDLPGDASEPVTVYVNQLTTVVVLNFVAPPEPAPVAIDVTKYTCAPGFAGTVYADFAGVCGNDGDLTNNVTFRLAGAATARRITGDGGRQGRTSFEGLASGDYVLREEPPEQAQTSYAFCGLDPKAPDLRRVGTDIALHLEAGQRLTCAWFNVPDDLTTTTGAIVVTKYGCPVSTPPAGFAWYDECDPQGAGVQFALTVQQGSTFVPESTGATDGDGLLRFSRLEPGTYHLKEIGGEWCHAESDSVNARGDVIVRTGARASVFIFNCLGTKNPPNTGAGPGAGPPSGVGAGPGLLLGIAWPLAGLAALGARRRRIRWVA